MKTFFIYFLVVMFSPSSEEWKGSIMNGEPPVYHTTITVDTEAECNEARAVAQILAERNGDYLFYNHCYEFVYDPSTGAHRREAH